MHTIIRNFCHAYSDKISQLEEMGNDACLLMGYQNKVSSDRFLQINCIKSNFHQCLTWLSILRKTLWNQTNQFHCYCWIQTNHLKTLQQGAYSHLIMIILLNLSITDIKRFWKLMLLQMRGWWLLLNITVFNENGSLNYKIGITLIEQKNTIM